MKGRNNIIFLEEGQGLNLNNKATKSNTSNHIYATRFENNIMKEVTVVDFSRRY